MSDYDLIIAGGTIIDGQRSPRFKGDIGIRDGRVAAITGAGGLKLKTADRRIEADGLIVAPGFVDLHTHYDAQLFWDPHCTIGGWHGITSVVIGNCGFGLAPCPPDLRERAMLSLTRNEAISYDAMKVGLPWDWETFPEYLDSVERTPKAVNVAAYVGLAPVVAQAMGGIDIAKSRRPTEAETSEMKRIIVEAMEAGACGISTQRLGTISVQRDYDGTPMVTDTFDMEDFYEIASALKQVGRGAVQALGFKIDESERVSQASGVTVIHNAVVLECDQHGLKMDDWRHVARHAFEANQRGNRIALQLVTIGNDFEFTLEDWNMYDFSPLWRDLTMGSVEERLTKMADPARRPALREEYDHLCRTKDLPTGVTMFDMIEHNGINLVRREDLRHCEGMTVGQLAKAEGKHPVDAMLDLAVADNLATTFATPPQQLNPGEMGELISLPFSIPGVSDGGAHMKFVWFGRYPTEYLTKWVREHQLVDLEYAHWHLSAAPAAVAGLSDRGVIRVGAPADIIVYDFEKLGMTEVVRVDDLPAGDWRRINKGIGYCFTIVNGVVTLEDNVATGEMPGALLRFGMAAPERMAIAAE